MLDSARRPIDLAVATCRLLRDIIYFGVIGGRMTVWN
jgi:hypothetical protein